MPKIFSYKVLVHFGTPHLVCYIYCIVGAYICLVDTKQQTTVPRHFNPPLHCNSILNGNDSHDADSLLVSARRS